MEKYKLTLPLVEGDTIQKVIADLETNIFLIADNKDSVIITNTQLGAALQNLMSFEDVYFGDIDSSENIIYEIGFLLNINKTVINISIDPNMSWEDTTVYFLDMDTKEKQSSLEIVLSDKLLLI